MALCDTKTGGWPRGIESAGRGGRECHATGTLAARESSGARRGFVSDCVLCLLLLLAPLLFVGCGLLLRRGAVVFESRRLARVAVMCSAFVWVREFCAIIIID